MTAESYFWYGVFIGALLVLLVQALAAFVKE
jgi:hypothetical protein